MVVTVEARKITLPLLSSSSLSSSSVIPPHPISLLFDPDSLSLALMLSDSSISLHYPFLPFSPLSSNLPPPKTLIPPATSAATFLRLASSPPKPNSSRPNFSPTLLISAGITNDAVGSKALLRFYVKFKEAGEFVRARVTCGQKGIDFDRRLGGIVVADVDGSKVLLAGSVNYFAMYSESASSVWLFGVKLSVEDQSFRDGGEGEGLVLKLVKCAVINCTLPVSSICVSSGFFIMGELNGVRVFPLRPLVKGKVGIRKKGKMVGRENGKLEAVVKKKVNGEVLDLKVRRIIKGRDKIFDLDNNVKDQSKLKVIGNAVGKVKSLKNGTSLVVSVDDTHASGAVKPKLLNLNQDSSDWGASFVPFSDSKVGGSSIAKETLSIHVFSQQKFLILDSNGHTHILHASMSNPCTMKELNGVISVDQLAILPAMPDSTQTVWTSDGLHSVHKMTMPYVGSSTSENESTDSEDVQVLVTEVIFTSERIQKMIPLSANAVLILGQDNLYAYAIS